MREQLLRALLAHAQGDIAKHKANVEIYLEHPAGIGEHSNIIEAIEQEINEIAKYQDQIDIINKYFRAPSDKQFINKLKQFAYTCMIHITNQIKRQQKN